MKKIFILLSIFVFTLGTALHAYDNHWKLAVGVLFTAAGGVLSYQGMKVVNVTDPGVRVTGWNWDKEENGSWSVDYGGIFEVDGNVDLNNIEINVTFRDAENTPIGTDSAVLSGSANLSPGSTVSFSGTYGALADEPYYATVAYTADYTAVMESNSPGLGISGIAMTVCGVYLLADYFIDFGSLFSETGVEVGLYPNYDGAAILAAKSF